MSEKKARIWKKISLEVFLILFLNLRQKRGKNFKFRCHLDSLDTSPKVKWPRCNVISKCNSLKFKLSKFNCFSSANIEHQLDHFILVMVFHKRPLADKTLIQHTNTATWTAVQPPNPGWLISSRDILSINRDTRSTSPLKAAKCRGKKPLPLGKFKSPPFCINTLKWLLSWKYITWILNF